MKTIFQPRVPFHRRERFLVSWFVNRIERGGKISKFTGIREIEKRGRATRVQQSKSMANELNSKKREREGENRYSDRRCRGQGGGEDGGGSHWPGFSTSFHLLNLHFFSEWKNGGRGGRWRNRGWKEGEGNSLSPSSSLPSFIQIFSTRNIHFLESFSYLCSYPSSRSGVAI